jgi:hypothetical protein
MSARNPPVGCLSFRSASDTSHLSLIYVRAHDEIIALSVMRASYVEKFWSAWTTGSCGAIVGDKIETYQGHTGQKKKKINGQKQ